MLAGLFFLLIFPLLLFKRLFIGEEHPKTVSRSCLIPFGWLSKNDPHWEAHKPQKPHFSQSVLEAGGPS